MKEVYNTTPINEVSTNYEGFMHDNYVSKEDAISKEHWTGLMVMFSRQQMHSLVLMMLNLNESPVYQQFPKIHKALSITSDGYVLGSVTKVDGEVANGFIGEWEDLCENLKGFAQFLKFDEDEKAALRNKVAECVGVSYVDHMAQYDAAVPATQDESED